MESSLTIDGRCPGRTGSRNGTIRQEFALQIWEQHRRRLDQPKTAPATQMLDTVPPAIGEAVECARKGLTKDVSKFLRAKQKAQKSATELGEFDDDRSSLLTRYEASHPSNNTGKVGQTTCKYGNAADGTGGEKSHKAQLEDKRWKRGYCHSAKFAHQTDNEAL